MSLQRPLRFTVPLGIFIVGSILIAGYYISEYRLLSANIRHNGIQEMRMIAALSTGEIEYAYRNRELKVARAAIWRLASMPGLAKIALTSENAEILYSSPPGHAGKHLTHLFPELSDTELSEVLDSASVAMLSPQHTDRQIGFFPVQIRNNPDSLLPTDLGWLVFENDLAGPIQQRHHQLLVRTLPYIVVLIMLSVALWWIFRRVLLYRIQRLSAVTRAIATGDFTAVPEIGGKDELDELSIDLMQMARQLRENTEALIFFGEHDKLTGLLNKRGFEQRLEMTLYEARQTDKCFLLLYLDIDSFRILNDTQGHSAGDALIVDFAQRLVETLEDSVALARLGGDEFALILPCTIEQDPETQVRLLHDALTSLNFHWQGELFQVRLSIGVVIIDGTIDASELLSRADSACYAAKDRGRNRVQFWRDDELEFLQHHGQMRWARLIVSAINEDRFALYAQPIMPLQADNNKLHFEVLIRMHDENGKLVFPGEFLSAAERFQLSTLIDQWVIERTFRLLNRLGTDSQRLETCAINLSGLSLGNDEIIKTIRNQFASSRHLLPRQVCFEITETAAITNLSLATRFIEELRGMDCRIALDDFGSGVSSFGYLKNLPVDIIKIDGMFVRDMLNSPLDSTIVRTINDIAHVMGKQSIAEFSETEQITSALRELGIDYAQGYGVARPMPLAELLSRELSVSLPPG